MQCGGKVAGKRNTHTHNLLGIGKVTTCLSNNLNWSIKSAVCLLLLKAKQFKPRFSVVY
jgi:hypothetical protein